MTPGLHRAPAGFPMRCGLGSTIPNAGSTEGGQERMIRKPNTVWE